MPTFEDLFPNLPTMRSVFSQIALPFSSITLADTLPPFPLPAEVLMGDSPPKEQPKREPSKTTRTQRQARKVARGGYRLL